MRLQTISWLTMVLFVTTFALVDVGLVALIHDTAVRMVVRWLIVGGACLTITVLLGRRTIHTVLESVRRERAARSEAVALANLAETVAAGNGIDATLAAAVEAVPRLFGTAPYEDVRCSVALPNTEGLLRSWLPRLAAPFTPSCSGLARASSAVPSAKAASSASTTCTPIRPPSGLISRASSIRRGH